MNKFSRTLIAMIVCVASSHTVMAAENYSATTNVLTDSNIKQLVMANLKEKLEFVDSVYNTLSKEKKPLSSAVAGNHIRDISTPRTVEVRDNLPYELMYRVKYNTINIAKYMNSTDSEANKQKLIDKLTILSTEDKATIQRYRDASNTYLEEAIKVN